MPTKGKTMSNSTTAVSKKKNKRSTKRKTATIGTQLSSRPQIKVSKKRSQTSTAKKIETQSLSSPPQITVSRKVSLQKSTTKKTSPTTSAGRLGKLKDWVPKSTRKRITTVAAAIVLAIVAIMLITFVVAIVGENPLIQPKPLISMTDKCQERYGACYYFPKKYVSSCASEQCYSLEIRMDIVQKIQPMKATVKAYLYFYPPTNIVPEAIGVPNDVACLIDGVYGRCHNGQCVKSDENDQELEQLKNQKPINGGWRKMDPNNKIVYENRHDPTKLDCIILPQNNDFFSNMNLTVNYDCQHPFPCYRYKFDFLSCTNPYPAFDGQPCWNDVSPMEWPEWPMQISKDECDRCPGNNLPQLNCVNQTYTKQCLFQPNIVGAETHLFETCCFLPLKNSKWPPNVPFGTNGRCVIGSCVPVDRTKI